MSRVAPACTYSLSLGGDSFRDAQYELLPPKPHYASSALKQLPQQLLVTSLLCTALPLRYLQKTLG